MLKFLSEIIMCQLIIAITIIIFIILICKIKELRDK